MKEAEREEGGRDEHLFIICCLFGTVKTATCSELLRARITLGGYWSEIERRGKKHVAAKLH